MENVKKDELLKKLDAKEHECLEYRAKLERQPVSVSLDSQTPTPVTVLEAEVEQRMAELREKMEESRGKIAGLIQEMQLIKTTAREKIVIPLDQSEAAVVDEFESSRRISAFDP